VSSLCGSDSGARLGRRPRVSPIGLAPVALARNWDQGMSRVVLLRAAEPGYEARQGRVTHERPERLGLKVPHVNQGQLSQRRRISQRRKVGQALHGSVKGQTGP